MREKLGVNDDVAVYDLREVGDLYYGELTEDGERPILRPERAAVVRLMTEAGEVWELDVTFGADFWNAEALAARIRATGHVNFDLWRFIRYVYGSRAYEDSGEEMRWAERERDDARWERVS